MTCRTDRRALAIETDEVVTLAPSRDVVLPNKAGTMALITLDNGHDHTKPNTFGPKGLGRLNKAIDAALARDEVVAIGVTGKPFILAAGADLTGVPKLAGREQALDLGKIGHGVMRKLTDGGKPSFAFVNGVALGGGLEVALHATYRTVSVAAGMLSTPEVFLGLLPGWGGNFLLPNLIGADKAVKVVVENALNQNKMLSGPEAVKFGIGDVLLDSADFLEQSLLWASKVLTGEVIVERPEIDRGDAWDAAVARGKGFADLKVSGAAPAPYRALDLIAAAKDNDRDRGFAAEDEALADLIMSEELRSGLYAFDLVNKRAKRPAGAPDKSLARPVSKVGVVGAGLMAGQLALLFARRLEVPVVLTDLDQERVDRGVGYVHGEIDKLLGKGRIRPDKANQLKALVTGSVDRARLRRRRLRDRGGLRGTAAEEDDLRRPGEDRPAGRDPGDQHRVAVDHRDGRRPGAPRAGRRVPLLQPGRGAAAAGDHPRRRRPTTRRWRRRSRSARS